MSSENIVWSNITVYRRFSEEYFALRVKRPLRFIANALIDGLKDYFRVDIPFFGMTA